MTMNIAINFLLALAMAASVALTPAVVYVCFSYGWNGQFPERQLLLRIVASWVGVLLVLGIFAVLVGAAHND